MHNFEVRTKQDMNNSISLTISVSTIRPIQTMALIASLVNCGLKEGDEVIIFFDIVVDKIFKNIFEQCYKRKGIHIIYNNSNLGLSHNRNRALTLSKNKYLIFFDDDTVISKDLLNKYRIAFFNNQPQIIGGPLILPSFYPKIPNWLPPLQSALLGIHGTQKRIWGGNWGIDTEYFKQHNISFQSNLGRKGKGLQSGDESSIIEQVSLLFGKVVFDKNLKLMHCIDQERYSIFYMIRRTFWQGRSEVRKKTILTGLKKDFKRSMTTLPNLIIFLKLKQKLVGSIFFISFCTGILLELFRKLILRDTG